MPKVFFISVGIITVLVAIVVFDFSAQSMSGATEPEIVKDASKMQPKKNSLGMADELMDDDSELHEAEQGYSNTPLPPPNDNCVPMAHTPSGLIYECRPDGGTEDGLGFYLWPLPEDDQKR